VKCSKCGKERACACTDPAEGCLSAVGSLFLVVVAILILSSTAKYIKRLDDRITVLEQEKSK
jgi:hypothetical protein